MNTLAMWLFLPFVALTLAASHLAARRTSGETFFNAGGQIGAWQNGLALAGDYLSAAAFLGAAGLYFGAGYDSLAYAVGTLAGWPLLMLLLSGKLRRSGAFTLADVLRQRFDSTALACLCAASALTVTLVYLVVQLVGAGKLLALLFGLPYPAAVGLVTALMIAYVAVGGMLATTWVQAIKAVLLIACSALLALATLARFGFSPVALFDAAAAQRGAAILLPSPALANPWEVLSLGLGLTLGLLGLPHVLMRFHTVRDVQSAHRSAKLATVLIALVFLCNLFDGYGSVALLPTVPSLFDADGKLAGGGNMAAVHLAALLGGPVLAALLAAVAFATILAVVSGLTIAGSATLAHDVWQRLLCRGEASARQVLYVSRGAALLLGVAAALLALAFEAQNIAFLIGLAFAIAASANFPVLLLALYWRNLSARGAAACIAGGITASVSLIVTGPAVWVSVLGFDAPLFPLANPALVSVPLAFAVGWLSSRPRRP